MVEVHGGRLECKHCGHGEFEERKAQLNTAVASLFELDFLDKSAEVYVCRRCGFLHWFLDPKGR